MSLHGRLELHEGVVSAHADGSHIDGAHAGDTFGLELALAEPVRVFVGDDGSYRHPRTLSLEMSTMAAKQLLAEIADALGMPAFTEPEWLRIADVLSAVHGGDELTEFAARIRTAYGLPPRDERAEMLYRQDARP